jgi:hypothetical protein
MKKQRVFSALAFAALLASSFTGSTIHAATRTAAPAPAPVPAPMTKLHNIVLTFNEHKTNTRYFTVDTTANDQTGNYFVFSNPLYGADDLHRIGTSDGLCTFVSNTDIHCSWDLIFGNSKISIAGADIDQDSLQTYSVVGGTGRFKGISGTLVSHTFKSGDLTEYRYTILATLPDNTPQSLPEKPTTPEKPAIPGKK